MNIYADWRVCSSTAWYRCSPMSVYWFYVKIPYFCQLLIACSHEKGTTHLYINQKVGKSYLKTISKHTWPIQYAHLSHVSKQSHLFEHKLQLYFQWNQWQWKSIWSHWTIADFQEQQYNPLFSRNYT